MKMKGVPIVISAPSGGGKSTVASQVIKELPDTVLSISCTTRDPRPGEKDGVHYHFISIDEFKKRIKDGDFLEWAEVHGNYYGTPLSSLDAQLQKGKDVILTIDVQGALAVRGHFPQGIYIFLLPPTWETLKKRLQERSSDDPKAIERRLQNARKELSYLSHYEYLVLNDKLDAAVSQVCSIIRAEHCRLHRIDQRNIPILS